MADIADIANERAEQHLEKALAQQQARSGPESHPDFDGEHCIACDDEIPAARLALGKIRCVACQSRLEAQRRMRSA